MKNKPRGRFGGFSLRGDRKTRKQETQWAARSGPVTTSKITTRDEETEFSKFPDTQDEKNNSCDD